MKTPCKCRTCGKVYDEDKTRADYKGYCSQKCFHQKAKELGYRKGQTEMRRGWRTPQSISEYDVLKRHKQVGSVFVTEKSPE